MPTLHNTLQIRVDPPGSLAVGDEFALVRLSRCEEDAIVERVLRRRISR